MLLLEIDTNSGVPIYRQLVRQVRDAIVSGRVEAGEKLPSHRELAAQLVINHLTVKKAYDLLERDGLIETRRGMGTFVGRLGSRALAAERRRDVRDALQATAREASDAGLELDAALELVRQAWPVERVRR